MAAAMKTYASRCFVNFVGLRNILSLNIIGKSQIPSFFIVSACRTQLTPTFCLSCKALSTSSSVLARQRFREEYHVTVPELEENPMEVNDVEQTKDVLQKVTEEACAIPGQLFAVVHLTGRQLKVTTNDLVVARGNFPPDIGERICLEKVLLIGGSSFTMLGRPLLSMSQVRVEATVLEKTIGQTVFWFHFKKRKRFRKHKFIRQPYSVLRINAIDVLPGSLMEA